MIHAIHHQQWILSLPFTAVYTTPHHVLRNFVAELLSVTKVHEYSFLLSLGDSLLLPPPPPPPPPILTFFYIRFLKSGTSLLHSSQLFLIHLNILETRGVFEADSEALKSKISLGQYVS